MRDVEFTNGRNFIAQSTIDGGVTHRKALNEHRERMTAVENVAREITTLAFEIQEGK
jgi:hypothetical protein